MRASEPVGHCGAKYFESFVFVFFSVGKGRCCTVFLHSTNWRGIPGCFFFHSLVVENLQFFSTETTRHCAVWCLSLVCCVCCRVIVLITDDVFVLIAADNVDESLSPLAHYYSRLLHYFQQQQQHPLALFSISFCCTVTNSLCTVVAVQQ